jgi:uncharacterized protein YyaL (SSP411 family)
MAVTALLYLPDFNDLRAVNTAHQALAQVQYTMSQYPLGYGQWLQALSYTLSKPREITVFGDPDAADMQALLRAVRSGYRPFQVVAWGEPRSQSAALPLLQRRGLVERRAAACVCRALACGTPVVDAVLLCTEWAAL